MTSFLKYILGVLAFKCVKGLAPSYLCNSFKTRACVHDRSTVVLIKFPQHMQL